jgi:hypothetical protein
MPSAPSILWTAAGHTCIKPEDRLATHQAYLLLLAATTGTEGFAEAFFATVAIFSLLSNVSFPGLTAAPAASLAPISFAPACAMRSATHSAACSADCRFRSVWVIGFAHLAAAAVLATAIRCAGVSFSMRALLLAFPPLRPIFAKYFATAVLRAIVLMLKPFQEYFNCLYSRC